MYVPFATYRIQFHKGFRFNDAVDLAEYLRDLGVSDVYSSPIFKCPEDSTHGYDITDHRVLNPVLGGDFDFENLSNKLKENNMGIIVDMVPNHMGITDPGNSMWYDVLEFGRNSKFADFFDIDWRTYKEILKDRIEIPILGNTFGSCLENGEIKIVFNEERGLFVKYYENIFPLNPTSWIIIIELLLQNNHTENLERLRKILQEFHEVVETSNTKDFYKTHELKKQFIELIISNDGLRNFLQNFLDELNGSVGDGESFDDLEKILDIQYYRLCYWRVAGDEINYRRFFDVNSLAAIRVEEQEVFDHVHGKLMDLVRNGHIRGLRIDHPDGLYDPKEYFIRLQDAATSALRSNESSSHTDGIWIIGEKILGHSEQLRTDWGIHGTTGYDYLNLVNGLFVDHDNQGKFYKLYKRFTGSGVNFFELRLSGKKLVLERSLAGELFTLSLKLEKLAVKNRHTKDFSLQMIQEAVSEFIAAFPVYRSYIQPHSFEVQEEDIKSIETAISIAKKRNPSTDPSIWNWIRSLMLMEGNHYQNDNLRRELLDCILSLQQLTSPVMAKGWEDTAFYRDFPLASLNEVGGEPEQFGTLPSEFFKRLLERHENYPFTMNGTSTHDTKRSEDTRSRINVLSEIPGVWEKAIFRWKRLNSKKKLQVDGCHIPAAREEYLLYQTLLGIWPFHDKTASEEFVDRVINYMIKAGREAKRETSWINVNEDYEKALTQFVKTILDSEKSEKFLNDISGFSQIISLRGANNSLSQIILKCFSPGVPDFYQGSEVWDFSLVDPDNRRPVDYELRREYLEEVIEKQFDENFIKEITTNWNDGKIKLFVTHKCLAFRRAYPDLFFHGDLIPLEIQGSQSDHIIAFARKLLNYPITICVVPRLLTATTFSNEKLVDKKFWKNTEIVLPDGFPISWHNVLSHTDIMSQRNTIAVENILGTVPVEFLVSQ